MDDRKRLGIALFFAALITLGSLLYTYQTSSITDDDGELAEPFGPVFPRLERAPVLYVVNVTDLSYAKQLFLVSLQGIVNKNAATLYLEYGSTHWIEYLNQTYDQTYEFLAVDEALVKFKTMISGLVVYDPDIPETVNLATTIAAIDNLTITAPDLITWASGLTSCNVSMDLREGHWASFGNGPRIYIEMLETMYPSLDQNIIGMLIPEETYLRDYLIAIKAICIHINPGPFILPEENEVIERVIDVTPPKATFIGWFHDPIGIEENVGVQKLSSNGKVLLPADKIPNLSVFAAYDFEQKPTPRENVPKVVPAVEDKIYITFALSDGDNLGHLHNRNADMWSSPIRGTIPMGWTISPLAAEIAPPLFEYYSTSVHENDTLICGSSGAGVFYPDFFLKNELGPVLARTRELMDYTGLETIWLINSYTVQEVDYSDDVLGAYTDYLEPAGVFLDYGDVPLTKQYWIGQGDHHSGTPYIRATHLWDDTENFLAKVMVAKDSVKDRPFFIFAAVHIWSMDFENVMSIVESLDANDPNNDFKIVSATEFFELIQVSEVNYAREQLNELDEWYYSWEHRNKADVTTEVENAEDALQKGDLDSAASHASEANSLIANIQVKLYTAVIVLFIAILTTFFSLLLYYKRKKTKKHSSSALRPQIRTVSFYFDMALVFATGCAALIAFYRMLFSYIWNWPALIFIIVIAMAFVPLANMKRYKGLTVRERLVIGTALTMGFGLASFWSVYFVTIALFGFMMVIDASPIVRKSGPPVLLIPMVLAMIFGVLFWHNILLLFVFGTWAVCLGVAIPLGLRSSAQDLQVGDKGREKILKRSKVEPVEKDAPTPPTLFLVLSLMVFYIPYSRYLNLNLNNLHIYLWILFFVIPLGGLFIAYPLSSLLKAMIEKSQLKKGPPGAIERGALVGIAAISYGSLYLIWDPILMAILILLGQVCIVTLALITVPQKWLETYPPYFARDFVLLFTILNVVFILPVIVYTLYVIKLGFILNYLLYAFPISFAIGLAIMIVPVALYWRK